jgi:hypothetical protein
LAENGEEIPLENGCIQSSSGLDKDKVNPFVKWKVEYETTYQKTFKSRHFNGSFMRDFMILISMSHRFFYHMTLHLL